MNNILPDSSCQVVKSVVFNTKSWAGRRKEGRNRERKCHIQRIKPGAICTKGKVAKRGRIYGTLRYYFVNHQLPRTLFGAIIAWREEYAEVTAMEGPSQAVFYQNGIPKLFLYHTTATL